jgi:hypothetical protein
MAAIVAAFLVVTAIQTIMHFSADFSSRHSVLSRRSAALAVVVYLGMIAFTAMSSESAEYVIHISVDGLHPAHLQTQINAGLAPNFKRFQDEGAWTHNARTDYTHTITLPNHTSMITGRPVCSPAGGTCNPVGAAHTFHHGYTSNGDPLASWTLHNQGNLNITYKASTFDVVHDAGYSTALFASKNKFIIYEQSYNAANGAPHPNGADKINVFANPESSMTMQTQLLSDLAANNFKYAFVHYADLDDNGHTYNWGSSQYMSAIVLVDNYLGQLFNLVQTDPELAGRTAIVLSADHGGVTGTTSHQNASNPSNYTIPFYVWGAGVAHGDLYAFNNGTRTNPPASPPAEARPDYNAAGQPIRNGDGGNLALSLLGLNAIPGSLINAAQNLRVALPGDFNADNVVDAEDYIAWRKGVNTATTPAQYDLWVANFGRSYSGGSGAIGELNPAVPEPSVAAFVLISIILLSPVPYRRGKYTHTSCQLTSDVDSVDASVESLSAASTRST